MNELERLLVELGRTMREPDPPPAARRAAGRLRREHPRPQRLRLRGAVAVALLVAAVAGVPPSRPRRAGRSPRAAR